MATNADTQSSTGDIDYSVTESDTPLHPSCRRLLEYWHARLQPDGLMHRADFNPLDMPSLMGGMFVVEPVDGGGDLRYRLVGGENERRLGMKFTGLRFSECFSPQMAGHQIAFHNRVMTTQKPACLRGHFIGLDLEHVNFEAIYLPVRAESGQVQILGGLYDLEGYL